MIPKGKAAGLIAIFAAIGLITATGAFTTVTAERTATVSTAGDSSALLALDTIDSSANSDYAEITSGTLEINLAGSGDGVNLNALTQVNDVFKITNQGTQEVNVWITTNGSNAGAVKFLDGHATGSGQVIDSESSAHTLSTGDSVDISMEIDTRNMPNLGDDDELIDSITVHANATA